jgi:hypothetical protein
MKALAVKFQT